MNRYVIEGLLRDLVSRNRLIVIATATPDLEDDIFEDMEHALRAKTGGYGYQIQKIERNASSRAIWARGSGGVIFLPLEGRQLEGKRADVWAVAGARCLPMARRDPALAAIQRNAQRTDPNAEIILLD